MSKPFSKDEIDQPRQLTSVLDPLPQKFDPFAEPAPAATPPQYITKDSGQRQKFASGMQRDVQEGKTLWHLVASGPMLRRWAELLTRGAVKYEADNWMKAEGQAELDRFRASAFRHFMQWYYGDTDEDHAAAVFFNINGAEYVKGKLK
jgi:hypothetical protein